MNRRPIPEPCVVVIFGASGDLTHRKLAPALHNLQLQGLMPDETAVVGVARTPHSDDEFKADLRKAVDEHSRLEPSEESWSQFVRDAHYLALDVTDDEAFATIGAQLEKIDANSGTRGNRVWYMATVPSLFEVIAEKLGKSGLTQTGGWQRLVVEKPFGSDLDSALELNSILTRYFNEDEIYRIDHYLGKETVQNVLVFRFANAIFEPIWNRRYIDHVQITVAESLGIGQRGNFYERVGALRDVGQNHLLQLLALMAMEPPIAWDADAIRDEKAKLLQAIRRYTPGDCATVAVRGQYEGYRDESNVDRESAVETFFAMKLQVDNWRWADVPFYLRTGKCLPSKVTEMTIQFQDVPHLLFAKTAVEQLERNELIIRIQPDEGFSLRFGVKVPGPAVEVRSVDMEFDYENDFGSGTPEAYERLLLDCMLGDQTLFTRSDEIEQAWEIMDPVLKHWAQGGTPEPYRPGTWGPAAADELVRQEGRAWRQPSEER